MNLRPDHEVHVHMPGVLVQACRQHLADVTELACVSLEMGQEGGGDGREREREREREVDCSNFKQYG